MIRQHLFVLALHDLARSSAFYRDVLVAAAIDETIGKLRLACSVSVARR
jgi:hypothetical protein